MGSAFLTGWAIPESFYHCPEEVQVIDSTLLVRSLMENGKVSSDWDRLTADILKQNSSIRKLTGFSLGAIIALRIAQLLPLEEITLIAPTFSFISRENHPSGVQKKFVDTMISSFDKDRETVLNKFYRNCGIQETIECPYATEELKAGLCFLRDVIIPKEEFCGKPVIKIIQGRRDRIIPVESGKIVADYYGVKLKETKGAHVSPFSI